MEYRIILFLRFAGNMGARGIDIPRSLSKKNIALKELLADTKQQLADATALFEPAFAAFRFPRCRERWGRHAGT